MLSVRHFEMQDGQVTTAQQNGFYKLSTAILSRKELICEICKFQHTMTKSQKYRRTFTYYSSVILGHCFNNLMCSKFRSWNGF